MVAARLLVAKHPDDRLFRGPKGTTWTGCDPSGVSFAHATSLA